MKKYPIKGGGSWITCGGGRAGRVFVGAWLFSGYRHLVTWLREGKETLHKQTQYKHVSEVGSKGIQASVANRTEDLSWWIFTTAPTARCGRRRIGRFRNTVSTFPTHNFGSPTGFSQQDFLVTQLRIWWTEVFLPNLFYCGWYNSYSRFNQDHPGCRLGYYVITIRSTIKGELHLLIKVKAGLSIVLFLLPYKF